MLNELDCLILNGNTGYGPCYLDFKALGGGFIVPAGREYTPDETATPEAFLAALAADAKADLPADRVYPLGKVFNFTDGSEEPNIQTGSLGDKVITREGDYDWTYQFIDGGFCLLKSLRKFNGTKRSVIFYDINGVLAGTKSGVNMKGIPSMYYSAPFKIADGSNVSVYSSRFIHKPAYLNDNPAFVRSTLADIEAIVGLQDVAIELVSRTANVIKFRLKTACGSVNLYSTLSAELADAANYVAKTVGGAVLTITSVATDANIEGFTGTLDSSDPDYVSGVDVNFSMAAPSVLEGNGIVGYESNTILIP